MLRFLTPLGYYTLAVFLAAAGFLFWVFTTGRPS